MINEKIYFYEGNKDVYLDVNIIEEHSEYSIKKRPMMLICPGGSYYLCSGREADPISRTYLAEGYNTAVLYYTTKEKFDELYDHENDVAKPHFEVGKAMCIIRDNAERWNVDPEQIAVIGFSAGGHLAGCASILWNDEKLVKALGCPEGYNKPNAAILCYPVVTSGDKAHKTSFIYQFGEDETNPNWERYSLEKHVKPDNPPTFIFHTQEDPWVPVHNSIYLANAMADAKVPFELHIFPKGMHGMSTGKREVMDEKYTYNGRWVEWSIKWLETIFNF